MPRLAAQLLFDADGLRLRRVTCDGVDGPRPGDEHNEDPRLILVLHGRFEFQDSRTRAIASPATGLFLEDGHSHRISHIDGGDVCVVLQGRICETLVGSGSTARRLDAPNYVRLQALASRLAQRTPMSRLAVEELLCCALAPERTSPASGGRRGDREMAAAIAYRVERDLDARLSVTELAAEAGTSIFQACRVFRRCTGWSIHRYHQEVRLRHALALLLDTQRPIAAIANDLGFANQAHLTNLFRRRFQVTPARARRDGVRVTTSRVRRPSGWRIDG